MASPPESSFAAVATTTAGLFAGSALYISAVQQPALLRTAARTSVTSGTTSTACRLSLFGSMFGLAAPLQASLATLSGVAAVTTGLMQRERLKAVTASPSTDTTATTLWLTSGLLMIAIVPYTLGAMMKLNRQLLDTEFGAKQGDSWIETGLKKWGKLHGVRTGVSMVAFTSMVVALSRALERPTATIG